MENSMQDVPDREALLERLKAEHRALEARLAELERHISLTSEEQVERAQIKKLKLAKKDLIMNISRKNGPSS
ncbi:MAG: YdcH family protein [Pseudomonadota bacterium]